ncbi:MAG: hypothetical protein ACLPKW_26730 [Acetobacteraceae bacterium]
MTDPDHDHDHSRDAFFLIVADLDRGLFCVEGPMSDDGPWHLAVGRARQQHDRNVQCGPTGPDREALASEFQRTHGQFAGVPPGSILRPRA